MEVNQMLDFVTGSSEIKIAILFSNSLIIDHFTVVVSVSWPLVEARLEVTLL